MTLIRYAGFDPDEDVFDGVELAPLHPQDAPPRPVPRTRLDIARAVHLRGLGWGWNEVGRQLAIEAGRRVAYRGTSIYFAVNYAVPRGQS